MADAKQTVPAEPSATHQPEQTPKEKARKRSREFILPDAPTRFSFGRPVPAIKLDFARRMYQRFKVILFFNELVGQHALVPASQTWVMTDDEKELMDAAEKLRAITLVLPSEPDPAFPPDQSLEEIAKQALNEIEGAPKPIYYDPQHLIFFFEPERPMKGVFKVACDKLNLSGYTDRVNQGLACDPGRVEIGRGAYDNWYEHHIPVSRGSSIRRAGVKRNITVAFEIWILNQQFTGQQLYDMLLTGSAIGIYGNRSFGSGRYDVGSLEELSIDKVSDVPWWRTPANNGHINDAE